MKPSRRGEILTVSAIALLAVVWVSSKAVPARSPDSQMKLERFGALPLMYEGRIKPFDTLARNSLRMISNLISGNENAFGVAEDGLLYQANINGVQRLPGFFDLTEFEDWEPGSG